MAKYMNEGELGRLHSSAPRQVEGLTTEYSTQNIERTHADFATAKRTPVRPCLLRGESCISLCALYWFFPSWFNSTRICCTSSDVRTFRQPQNAATKGPQLHFQNITYFPSSRNRNNGIIGSRCTYVRVKDFIDWLFDLLHFSPAGYPTVTYRGGSCGLWREKTSKKLGDIEIVRMRDNTLLLLWVIYLRH